MHRDDIQERKGLKWAFHCLKKGQKRLFFPINRLTRQNNPLDLIPIRHNNWKVASSCLPIIGCHDFSLSSISLLHFAESIHFRHEQQKKQRIQETTFSVCVWSNDKIKCSVCVVCFDIKFQNKFRCDLQKWKYLYFDADELAEHCQQCVRERAANARPFNHDHLINKCQRVKVHREKETLWQYFLHSSSFIDGITNQRVKWNGGKKKKNSRLR